MKEHSASGLRPSFAENNIPIVLSTDDNFIPYICVALHSLIQHASPQNNYDIHILHKGVTPAHQQTILRLQRENVRIRFMDITARMDAYIERWYVHDWGLQWHSDSVYFRFFIPEIFSEYDKILFLDGDIIVCSDVAELYRTDLGDFWLGAVQDFHRQLDDDDIAVYAEETLKVPHELYFNAGIFLMNLRILRDMPFLKQCLATLKALGKPRLMDQDVFNVIFLHHVKFLDYRWNCLFWNVIYCHEHAEQHCSPEQMAAFTDAAQHAHIFHYAGRRKPWKEPQLEYSELFWKYARQTPFYEEILSHSLLTSLQAKAHSPAADMGLIRDALLYPSLKRRYYLCILLSAITRGNTQIRYQKERLALKARLGPARRFRKGLS